MPAVDPVVFLVIAVWLTLAGAIAYIAHETNVGAGRFFLMSIMLSPIAGALVLTTTLIAKARAQRS